MVVKAHPTHADDNTSAEHALVYVHNQLPGISPHDLVKLVASVGAETRGHYTFHSIQNAVVQYKNDKSFPQVGTKWIPLLPEIGVVAKQHGHSAWINGGVPTFKDLNPPNTKTLPERLADSGPADNVVNGTKAVGGAVATGFGDLFKSPLVILAIIIVIVVLVAKK